MLVHLAMPFGVIAFSPDSETAHWLTNWWVLVRCLNKLLRHFYQTYSALGLRFAYYPVDWIRMSSFYVIYTSEYILSLLLVIITIPVVKAEPSLQMPNIFNF